MKIRAGDLVVIISGKDKGKTGTVLRVLARTNRVVVGDVNMRTKHIRALPNRPGQIVRYEASIHASNVMLVDPQSKKRTRLGMRKDEKGRMQRVAKRSGAIVTVSAGAKKETKAEKPETKETAAKRSAKKAEKESSAQRVQAPEKSPFWKRMGFGAEAIEDAAEQQGAAHMKEDHSVPEETRTPESFAHQRGS
ncbi:50S ribosomal protein L24 [Candidatus Peregrinibacteria bacterium CG10_big_fil_rev_8_21_14_0_10_55_24]|nr:MAG: 50S ribosomal protein L24 [Candidatus Peregrinibacteria bacterium CG10_big_fil_rev_8_21_14_0_10_55_24]